MIEGGGTGESRAMNAKQVRDHERVLWRSRRGMLELDLLLVDFARARYPLLPSTDQRAYQRLLGLEDRVIWDWLQRQSKPTPAFCRIVNLIHAFTSERVRWRD
ncbi:MAG: succinate dehydrogenase assembly factor 2 [Gammaproteobacteria bacterium]|nr:succinate dehydrogenase assembly factor 2 [Gammaproteobacteria bacterium]